jgi:hypothetical protein
MIGLDGLARGDILKQGYPPGVVRECMRIDAREHQLPNGLEEGKRSAITDEDWEQELVICRQNVTKRR